MSDLPNRIVVGDNGAYWRDYGDHYSMCPVSEDNEPVEVVAVYIRLQGKLLAATPAIDVEHRQADELGHVSDGRPFHEAQCPRCGLLLAYLVRDQVWCVSPEREAE